MTFNLIRKELLDNLLSFRFVVSSIIVVFLMVLSVATMMGDYVNQRETHLQNRVAHFKEAESYDNYFELMFSGIRADRPPAELQIFYSGAEKNPNRQAMIFPFFKPSFMGELHINPVFPLFPAVDLLFVTSIVMSLMAFVFSYDAISGERENGTLKLLMSYSVPRDKIILAKWVGGYLTLIIPYIVGIILCCLLILINPRATLSGQSWAAFFLTALVSLLFIAVMYSVGLLVSVKSKISAASISILLFLWVIFVLVIPNAAPFVVEQLRPIDSPSQVMSRIKFKTGNNLNVLLDETIKVFEDATGYSIDQLEFDRGNQPEQAEEEKAADQSPAAAEQPQQKAQQKAAQPSGPNLKGVTDISSQISSSDLRDLKASGCKSWASKKIKDQFGITLEQAEKLGKDMGYNIDVNEIVRQCEARKKDLLDAASAIRGDGTPSQQPVQAEAAPPPEPEAPKEKVKPQQAFSKYMSLSEDEKFRHIDRMYQNTINAFTFNSEISKEEQEKYQRQVDGQVRITKIISRISPVSAYLYAVTDLANTGIEREKHLKNYLWDYQGRLLDFLRAKFNVPKDDRVHSIFGGFFREAEYNLSDLSQFNYQPMPLNQRFSIALIDIFVLFAFAVIFFMAAFVSFLRADIID